ncbi:hypothetical protein C0J45_15199 [Silurus meridionalis]|nr:hypothetical protein C0J45_15199 [Silurus meridionalis]
MILMSREADIKAEYSRQGSPTHSRIETRSFGDPLSHSRIGARSPYSDRPSFLVDRHAFSRVHSSSLAARHDFHWRPPALSPRSATLPLVSLLGVSLSLPEVSPLNWGRQTETERTD